jgi:uncharacterized protein YegL
MHIVSRGFAVQLVLALLLTLSLCAAATAQTEPKAAYGILIDNTGSMRSQFDLVINLSKGIVEQTHRSGPVSLFRFKTQGDPKNAIAIIASDLEWSQDKSLLEQYIDTIFVVPGQTKLRDGINAIAERLNTKVGLDKDAKKTIFLITDGEDRSSKITEKELLKELKESGIKVYAIGLVRELDSERPLVGKSQRDRAIALVERLAKDTDGRAVIPKSKKVDVGSLLNELFAK